MTLYWTLVLVVTAVAAWTDVRTGHIPNWLTGPAFVAALAVHGVIGGARTGASGAAIAVAWSLGGALLCAVPALVLFARGAMGGGDLKLFAAVGALVHPMQGLEVEVYAFVVAAVVSVGQIVQRGALQATLARLARRKGGAPLPPQLLGWLRLGPSIFVGAVITWALRHS